MTAPLSRGVLERLPPGVQVPGFDYSQLKIGIVHLGVGAFHRAHQAVYTEDAIGAAGGDWGIIGVSLRHAAVPDALARQDHLYTVEILNERSEFRVVTAIRASMAASASREPLERALAAARTQIITLTITEKGYCLGPGGELDWGHPDIAHDLGTPAQPNSAIGWLALGLLARHRSHGSPVTIISCDNLRHNGARLQNAVTSYLERTHPQILPWLRATVYFPHTVVDCIVPAATAASRERVARTLGFGDAACVQRETYSQWVIEDRFAGPRPAWELAGVQIVPDTADYSRLKLQVLNSCHSALAYLGLPLGYSLVREAIADPGLAQFLEELVSREIAPALAPLPVGDYWRRVKVRFENQRIDHRLAQIAEDGAQKMAERIFPLMTANLRSAAPISALARIVRAWMTFSGMQPEAVLDDPALFPADLRMSAAARDAVARAAP